MFAWLVTLGIALARSLRDAGSMEEMRFFVVREMAGRGIGFWLASIALLLGLAAAATSRGKDIAWIGLASGAAFYWMTFFR